MYFSVRIIPNQDNQEVEKWHVISAAGTTILATCNSLRHTRFYSPTATVLS